MIDGKTETKEEALALLRWTRRALVAQGRAVAKDMLRTQYRIHSRMLRAEMKNRGIDLHTDTIKEHWFGAVFNNCGDFRKLDETYMTVPTDYPNGKFKSHAGLEIPWWTLA